MTRDLHGHSGSGWIGVDLDGTLAEYHGWKGPADIGLPIPRMLLRVRRWLQEGKDVRILTARVAPHADGSHVPARAAIDTWCLLWLGRLVPVVHEKDSRMWELWDDRAVQVIPNTGLRADGTPEPELEAALAEQKGRP